MEQVIAFLEEEDGIGVVEIILILVGISASQKSEYSVYTVLYLLLYTQLFYYMHRIKKV